MITIRGSLRDDSGQSGFRDVLIWVRILTVSWLLLDLICLMEGVLTIIDGITGGDQLLKALIVIFIIFISASHLVLLLCLVLLIGVLLVILHPNMISHLYLVS